MFVAPLEAPDEIAASFKACRAVFTAAAETFVVDVVVGCVDAATCCGTEAIS